MANINTGGGSFRKKGKPQKKTLRVDFTPMVDMMMLLITFFMFCTTLAKPQVMDIAMPSNEKDPYPPLTSNSKTLTLLLAADNKLYYYHGIPNYSDYTSLRETDYRNLRSILLDKNVKLVSKINQLKLQYHDKKISEAAYKENLTEFKKSDESITVLIKPMDESLYENVVDALDEMQICGVGKYMVIDMEEGDKYLLENYKTKGSLSRKVGLGSI